ncbi:uncharacterized protein LOC136082091 [Hydra vulgaris]|uniref:Uncharacterized protein LOC136082091 n=1 Tax=Hydra vulgaris TaxID=6087 RepID=A0ABM4C5A3_HYDVU
MGLANVESEELLLRAFITGLPGEISKQLRAQVKIFGISLQDALNHARVLMTEKTKEEYVSTTISGFDKHVKKPSATDFNCYKCGKPGHVARICFSKKQIVNDGIKCFRCGESGHIARFCSLHQGNLNGESRAPAVSLNN